MTQNVQAPSWHFLIDENLPGELAAHLHAAGHDAEHVRFIGLRGQPDSEIYAYAQAHSRTIVTMDLAFGNAHRYPPPHAGIVLVRLLDTVPVAQRLQVIVSALTALAGQSLANVVVTIEVGRVRIHRTE